MPVVDVDRFLDRGPNGEGVMYGGPVLPSKEIGNVLELARMTPEQHFDVYGINDIGGRLEQRNEALGRPVTLHPHVQHREMPAAYKQHEWYVKVPSLDNRGIGWPVSIAEAQASGVGVCVTRFRPDLADYLGGAGFLVESLAEARDVITKPYPAELRELGFESRNGRTSATTCTCSPTCGPRPSAGAATPRSHDLAQLPLEVGDLVAQPRRLLEAQVLRGVVHLVLQRLDQPPEVVGRRRRRGRTPPSACGCAPAPAPSAPARAVVVVAVARRAPSRGCR